MKKCIENVKKIIKNYLKKVEFKHCYVPMLTEIVKSVCNGFYSFMIATDGSELPTHGRADGLGFKGQHFNHR